MNHAMYPEALWWYEMSTDHACLAIMVSCNTNVCLCALSIEERDVVLCVYPHNTDTVLSLMMEVFYTMGELIAGHHSSFERRTKLLERYARITHTTRAALFELQHPNWTRRGST